MWKVLILICEIAVLPADCQIETARDYFYAPYVQDMVTCGLHAQALAAETLPAATIARIEAGLEYHKTRCLLATSIDFATQSSGPGAGMQAF
jgi:hypothetical protein